MTNELYHHGILGQKWGVRRYQNEDGSLTAEGIKRYGVNKNGWVSKEGRKLMEADLREERDATGRAYRPDIYRYNVVKGWTVEDRFKDYKDIQKLINPELLKKGEKKSLFMPTNMGKWTCQRLTIKI